MTKIRINFSEPNFYHASFTHVNKQHTASFYRGFEYPVKTSIDSMQINASFISKAF